MNPIFKFCLRDDLKDNVEFLPKQSEDLATGYDVRCAQYDRNPITLKAGKYVMIPLGIKVFSPSDYWLELRPRSSTTGKKHMHCLYGVIDCSYENEMFFCGQYIPDISSLAKDLVLNFGDPIGQLVPFKRIVMQVQNIQTEEFDKLCKERKGMRGLKGFGEMGG